MKIFLHIGMEKTGSTTIQEFLKINRAQLQKQGIKLSNTLGEGNNLLLAAYAMSHHRTSSVHTNYGVTRRAARIAFDLKVSSNFMREVKRVPPSCHSLILSTEHCHSTLVEREELEKLRELLNRISDDITIIVYLRRQVDVCASLYSTALKLGLAVDFNSYFLDLSLTHFYNYFEMIQLWSSIFGNDRIKVRLFDTQQLVGNDLIVDFSDAVGIEDVTSLLLPARTNKSLKPDAQELMLQLNRFQEIDGSDAFGDLHAGIKAYLIENYSGKGPLPSRALAAEKQSLFDDSNAKLKALFFPDSDSLFSTCFDEFPD